jgi:hypothetical protein
MVTESVRPRRRGLGTLAALAMIGALLVPLAVASTASAGSNAQGCGVAQGGADCCVHLGGSQGNMCCPESLEGVAQGIDNVCCADELVEDTGLAQGGNLDLGVECCPNGEFGHWEWGGYAGQNLSYCDAPPYEPPATAPPATVSPATSAPKKAAPAAKPVFTG